MDIRAGQVYSLSTNDSIMCAVLTVTNLGLKPKIAAEHPPVVVYVNDKGAVRSLVATAFMERWEFTGDTVVNLADWDPSSEFLKWIDGDTVDDTTDETDGDDTDTVEDDADGPEEVDVEDVEEVDVSQIDAFRTGSLASDVHTSTDGPTLSCGPHPLRDQLEAAFLSYSVRPMLSGDGVGFPVHCLEFLVSDQLTIEDIGEAFDPTNDDIIDVFSVGDIKVDWDGYSGVYPTIQAGIGTIATVWLTAESAAPAPATQAQRGAVADVVSSVSDEAAVAVVDTAAPTADVVDQQPAQAEVQFVTVS